MIQRPQTIYLLLASVALVGFLVAYESWAYAVVPSLSNLWPAIVAGTFCGLATIVSLVTIFLYKDRTRQKKLVGFAQWLVVLGFAALIVGVFLSEGGLDVSGLMTFFLPLVAYLFLWLSRRRIEKDDELVRSMDRLR